MSISKAVETTVSSALSSSIERQQAAAPSIPTPNSSLVDAVKVTLSKNLKRSELEKHLDDYSKGKGYLSKKAAGRLGSENVLNNGTLSQLNPKALKAYSGLYGALSYSQRARFVNGVSDNLSLLNKIKA